MTFNIVWHLLSYVGFYLVKKDIDNSKNVILLAHERQRTAALSKQQLVRSVCHLPCCKAKNSHSIFHIYIFHENINIWSLKSRFWRTNYVSPSNEGRHIVIPPASKVWGVYRNHPVCLSVCPSMYLVSATPPKRLIGFLWNFTQL